MNHLLKNVILFIICLLLASCILVVLFIGKQNSIQLLISIQEKVLKKEINEDYKPLNPVQSQEKTFKKEDNEDINPTNPVQNQEKTFKKEDNEDYKPIKPIQNQETSKKPVKWACFLNSSDYEEKIKPFFKPRDLRLFSCLFNIDPFKINETKILVVGSKKKVGSILVNIFKHNNIKYGRIKNRYHFNMTNPNVTKVLTVLNFKTVIDLTNDIQINSILENLFSTSNLIRTFSINSNSSNEINNYKGKTIITDKIFNPIFYPNSMHTRETGDLNYYIFDKYFLNQNQQFFNKNQKYTCAREIANTIYNLIINKDSSNQQDLIDLRSKSKTAEEIIQKVVKKTSSNSGSFEYSIDEIVNHYKKEVDSTIITPNTKNIYTSHVTIVSEKNSVINRYKTACLIVDEALRSFYGMISVEFICVTNIQPKQYSKFDWLKDLPELKKRHILISIPLPLLNSIKKKYGINYFPEYFLRNIGLRRSRGKYMLSGSSDVIMPPHFFLGIRKHLFSKNYLLRTIRIRINSRSIGNSITYASLFNTYVKNYFFRNKIVNTEFPNWCEMPCNPRNRDCGDFQGFHRNFWYKMNAYYNGYENYNVDSLLDYHLLGMFTPIMYKLMFGEQHIIHPSQSAGTPGLPQTIYCGPISVKKGIFNHPYDGEPNWGFINEKMPTRYSNEL